MMAIGNLNSKLSSLRCVGKMGCEMEYEARGEMRSRPLAGLEEI
jgi:hypothetical protein